MHKSLMQQGNNKQRDEKEAVGGASSMLASCAGRPPSGSLFAQFKPQCTQGCTLLFTDVVVLPWGGTRTCKRTHTSVPKLHKGTLFQTDVWLLHTSQHTCVLNSLFGQPTIRLQSAGTSPSRLRPSAKDSQFSASTNGVQTADSRHINPEGHTICAKEGRMLHTSLLSAPTARASFLRDNRRAFRPTDMHRNQRHRRHGTVKVLSSQAIAR